MGIAWIVSQIIKHLLFSWLRSMWPSMVKVNIIHTWSILITEAVTVSNVIAIASLVSEIWLATERHRHTHTLSYDFANKIATTFNPFFHPSTGFLSLLVSSTKSWLFVSTATWTLPALTYLSECLRPYVLSVHLSIPRFCVHHVSPPKLLAKELFLLLHQQLGKNSSTACTTLPTSPQNTSFHYRSFARYGPRIWNDLPYNVRHCEIISSFKNKQKIHLFSQFLID